MKTTICVVEDRPIHEPAVKILLLSLAEYCPATPVHLFYTNAKDGFATWSKKCPQVTLIEERPGDSGWDVKPEALMHLLDKGYDEVIWIDSDILVNRGVLEVFAGLDGRTFAATEDALGGVRDDPDALRARMWGFPVGRVLPHVLNSCVLRVTKAHVPLMERWREVQRSSTFQEAKRQSWNERPIHLKGGQDVLTALLTSKEFSDIPIHILRRGKDILQFNGIFGFTVGERLRSLVEGPPPFVHSFADKPWSERWPSAGSMGRREAVGKLYLDLSPYTLIARRYRDELECDTGWMNPHYWQSRFLRMLGLNHPALAGVPVAVLGDAARVARKLRR